MTDLIANIWKEYYYDIVAGKEKYATELMTMEIIRRKNGLTKYVKDVKRVRTKQGTN